MPADADGKMAIEKIVNKNKNKKKTKLNCVTKTFLNKTRV